MCGKSEVTENLQLHALTQSALEIHEHLELAYIIQCKISKSILQMD